MTAQEVQERLNFMDGIQKARMLVLRQLLREDATFKALVQICK